jgi:hypothetical protein
MMPSTATKEHRLATTAKNTDMATRYKTIRTFWNASEKNFLPSVFFCSRLNPWRYIQQSNTLIWIFISSLSPLPFLQADHCLIVNVKEIFTVIDYFP